METTLGKREILERPREFTKGRSVSDIGRTGFVTFEPLGKLISVGEYFLHSSGH
jgi:hypothetical protein